MHLRSSYTQSDWLTNKRATFHALKDYALKAPPLYLGKFSRISENFKNFEDFLRISENFKKHWEQLGTSVQKAL